jgi:hypothetical protein
MSKFEKSMQLLAVLVLFCLVREGKMFVVVVFVCRILAAVKLSLAISS